jgi:hypothetical protein
LDEVRLLRSGRAVVEVDRDRAVQAARPAQERRDADAAGDPRLASLLAQGLAVAT